MNTNGKNSPLKDCIQFIEECKKEGLKGDTPYSEGEEGESFDITGDRIFKIPECDEKRKLGFVDGGTASILSASDFSISLTRIAGVIIISHERTLDSFVSDIFTFKKGNHQTKVVKEIV